MQIRSVVITAHVLFHQHDISYLYPFRSAFRAPMEGDGICSFRVFAESSPSASASSCAWVLALTILSVDTNYVPLPHYVLPRNLAVVAPVSPRWTDY